MRWLASLVAETHRIFVARRRVPLSRPTSGRAIEHGRLRLLYEAIPIAMLVEQAGGGATDGLRPASSTRRLDRAAPAHAADLRLGRQGRARRAAITPTPTYQARPLAAVRRTRPVSRLRTDEMSTKHPIISVVGSSGAGTSTVKHTFDQIFRREGMPRPRSRATPSTASTAPT